jgi:hypothetical protein
MRRIELNDLSSIGLVKDASAVMLAPPALTVGENIRFVDDAIERLSGREAIFGTPPEAPHFLLPITGPTQIWWLWVSLTKAYVYNGLAHTEITRASGDYTASATRDWNGTVLGGIPILNNGIDIPQFWADYDAGQVLADLTNWPSTLRAKIVRAFGPFLVAYHVTDGGDVFPHRVRWSHPADPGSVPSSWAIDDPALDGGQIDLADANAGLIQDAIPLGAAMYIYKEGSIWRQRYIGGASIFEFQVFNDRVGILAPRCVGVTDDGQQHFLATQDNLAYHNGNTLVPILGKRMRRELFNSIDVQNYANSFVFCNSLFSEMWFCYPEAGAVQANRALIWNYGHGSERGVVSEAEVNFRNADLGTLQSSGLGLWSEMSETWAEIAEAWAISNRRKVVLVGTDATKFYQMDSGTTFDGTPYTSTVSRDALGLIGRKADDTPIVDLSARKYIPRIWPKITGAAVNVRLGFRDLENATMNWSDPQEFDPTIHRYCDFDGSGIIYGWEISSSAGIWRCDGFIFDIEKVGEH